MKFTEVDVTDDELIYQMRLQDEIARKILMERYTPHLLSWMRECFQGFPSYSYDKNDVMQLCWIAFFDAIESYWEEYGLFYSFARLCVKRQLYSYLRSSRSNGLLHAINEVSLDIPLYDDNTETLSDRIESTNLLSSPNSYYVLQEVLEVMNDETNDVLSKKERLAIKLKMQGYNTNEIASKLKLTAKAADNIVRRGRKKLQKYVNYE